MSKAIHCPITRNTCTECALYRGRHHYLNFSKRGQGCCTAEPMGLRALDPFGGAKPRLLRRGKKATLRVNPEQTQASRPGGRRVDFRAFEKLLEPWAGKDCQERSEPDIRLKVIDMETEATKIFNFDDAKTWDWSNPLTLRLIDGRHINSLARFTEILKYKIEKGCEEVEIYEGPRFMLLGGG